MLSADYRNQTTHSTLLGLISGSEARPKEGVQPRIQYDGFDGCDLVRNHILLQPNRIRRVGGYPEICGRGWSACPQNEYSDTGEYMAQIPAGYS